MAENEKNIGTTISLEKKEQLELDRSVGCSPANFLGGAELGLSMQARSSALFFLDTVEIRIIRNPQVPVGKKTPNFI